LLLLVLTSVTLLTLDYRGFAPLNAARSGVLSVFAPVGDAASAVFRPFGNAWSGAFDYDRVRKENEQLREQLNALQAANTTEQSASDELRQLKEQLNLPYVGQSATEVARVTSGPIANFDQTIEINKGSDAGIERGMPVVAGAGLIGQVVRVSGDRSVVKLVTDPTFSVGVRVQGAPGLGVANGTGSETRLRAEAFDIRTALNEGDLLVTSGAARSSFPPDVPVGKVATVRADDQALLKEADVDLLANLNSLLFVTVIKYQPPN
jgi:rod shape-determining protein MreC